MKDATEEEEPPRILSFRTQKGIGLDFNQLSLLFAEQKADVTQPCAGKKPSRAKKSS